MEDGGFLNRTRTGRVSIRRASRADAEALAALRWAFRAELGTPVEERGAFVRRTATWMAPRLEPSAAGSDARSGWLVWVAESFEPSPRLVGSLWLQLLEKIPNPVAEPEWHGYVSNVYVAPEARGAGSGAALLEAAIAEAKRRRLDRLFLWPSEKSRPLYGRAGFRAPGDLLELDLG